MSNQDTILKLDNLSKLYVDGSGNSLEILRDIDFSFQQMKTVSIVGESGSGKSTLLNLMGGLDRPTTGAVNFKGQNINELNSNQLSEWRNLRIGFIFQAHHLLPDFNALENVILPALIADTPREKCNKRAEELLDLVGLADRKSHKPSQLSGGEQQRIAIARALINSPEIILADEPTGNLDNKTSDKVSQLLLDVCQGQNTTLIMVTHNTSLAASMEVRLSLFDGGLSPV